MTLRALKDIAERTVTTYLEVFVGLLIASGLGAPHVNRLSILSTTALAAIPAALAVLKGALATLTGNNGSASLVSTVTTAVNPVPPLVAGTVNLEPVPPPGFTITDGSATKTLAPPGTQPAAKATKKPPAKKAAEIRKAASPKKAR